MRTVVGVVIAVIALSLGSCGGGGGGGGDGDTTPPPPQQPFGLTSRPPAAQPTFPLDTGSPGAVALQTVAGGFSQPLFFTAIPTGSGHSAVVEKGGRIRVLDAGFAAAGVLLDLSTRVITAGEQGLLGLAFDPDVAVNGYFYVHYNSAQVAGRCAGSPYPRCSRISRFRLNGSPGSWRHDTVDPAGEQLLLEVPQPLDNHKGGMLAFGPDNYLYIALGDGGGAGDPQGNGQNRATLLGKLLRIDPRGGTPYAIPADNPFANAGDGSRPEIWAYGLRNPWRFSFDRQSGALWLADVGQNAWEEINLIERGGNYGWNLREGAHPFSGAGGGSGLIDPIWEYGRGDGMSVTGGYVYRGSDNPGLRGLYVYGDFVSGRLWALDGGGNNRVLLDSGRSISSFGEDAAAELYAVDFAGNLLRLVETAGSGGTPPGLLSATGLFTGLAPLQPVPGLIEYDVNTPLWSDHTDQRRWIALPAQTRITFAADGAWQLPPGSVVVKEFSIALDARMPQQRRRLETRVLVHESAGWAGYTYRWNQAQTEAVLVTSAQSEQLAFTRSDGTTFSRRYDYPSSAQCLSCHTQAAGRLLGLRTRQINRDFDYDGVIDNQLRSFNHIALFDRDIGAAGQYAAAVAVDSAAPLAQRARDYLDANCAQCHQPGGPTGGSLDLRATIALSASNAVNVPPSAGDLGLADARIIAPGAKERSVLWERMRRADPTQGRMPPLASHAVDEVAVAVIGAWIDSL